MRREAKAHGTTLENVVFKPPYKLGCAPNSECMHGYGQGILSALWRAIRNFDVRVPSSDQRVAKSHCLETISIDLLMQHEWKVSILLTRSEIAVTPIIVHGMCESHKAWPKKVSNDNTFRLVIKSGAKSALRHEFFA